MLEALDEHLAKLAIGPLSISEVSALERTIERYAPLLDDEPSHLAHGDFDETHIFHANPPGSSTWARYGGAPPLYDAAHYGLHDRWFSKP